VDKTAYVKVIKGISKNVFRYGIRVNNSQGTENEHSLSRGKKNGEKAKYFGYKKASKLKYIHLLAI